MTAVRTRVDPITAAVIHGALDSIAVEMGPVSARDTGTRPIEISQSRLETRPSIDVGTCRCFAVAQTIVPAVSSALKTKHASISCHTAWAIP